MSAPALLDPTTEPITAVPTFRLLGPLSLVDGATAVPMSPSRPTTVLAVLLAHPNTVVTGQFLQRAVWGDEPPGSARAALQTCIARLRRVFVRHGFAASTVQAVSGGYRITVGDDDLDLLAFRRLLAQAAGAQDAEQELAVLRQAVALWQGPVLSNVESDILHRDTVPRLVEEKLLAGERICDLQIGLGRCRESVAELWSLTAQHPGRERFSAQLVECLYRTGRQGEALAEIRRLRAHLDTELGVDPGPQVRALEMAILRGEELPALAGPSEPSPRPAEPVVAPVVPLPGPGPFVGRDRLVTAIVQRLTDPARTAPVLLTGAPGIGKTAIAERILAQAAPFFPGGVLRLAVGELDDPARHWAGSGERMLVLLDGIDCPAQVRAVLAAAPPGPVLVTSRRSLSGLVASHGARVHRVGPLPVAASEELLQLLLGDQTPVPVEWITELAHLCDHHPLALRIAAARWVSRPGLLPAEAVHWLRSQWPERLSVPGERELSIPGLLDAHVDTLDDELTVAFRAAAAVAQDRGGVTVNGYAVAWSVTTEVAEGLLDALVDVGLAEFVRPGEYLILPLFRAFARRTAALTRAG